MNQVARNAITNSLRMLERDIESLPDSDTRREDYIQAADSIRGILGEPMQANEQADSLELYITTSDKRTLDAFDFAFRHVSRVVDSAARELAKFNAAWHDDPTGDPEGHAKMTAPAIEQFTPEARAAVVMALLKRCERVRQENIINGGGQ